MKYEDKIQIIGALNEEAVLFHDIEDALIGYLERFGKGPLPLYDYDKAIECLARGMDDLDDPYESAVEWIHYNTIGSWLGEKGTPAFIQLFDREDCECSAKEEDSSKKIVKVITVTQEDSGE